MTGRELMGEIAGRVLRPPFWMVKVLARLPLFHLRDVLFYVDTRECVVALTLDDGPDDDLTLRVLETLQHHDSKATFFLLGKAGKHNRKALEEIAAQGHEIGNHTWKDESSAALSEAELRRKLSNTHEILVQGDKQVPVRFFRPGGGWLGWRGHVVTVAKAEHDYKTVLGSVYPNDVRVHSDANVIKDVLKRVRRGGIIILHEGGDRPKQPPRARIVDILDQVLSELHRRGYRVVTVSELLAARDR